MGKHPALAHHFDDLEQQREAGTLGMWVFLATELMVFGGLFTGYTVYRWMYATAFGEASGHLIWQLASVLLMAWTLQSILRGWRSTAICLASPLTPLVLAHGQNAFVTASECFETRFKALADPTWNGDATGARRIRQAQPHRQALEVLAGGGGVVRVWHGHGYYSAVLATSPTTTGSVTCMIKP